MRLLSDLALSTGMSAFFTALPQNGPARKVSSAILYAYQAIFTRSTCLSAAFEQVTGFVYARHVFGCAALHWGQQLTNVARV